MLNLNYFSHWLPGIINKTNFSSTIISEKAHEKSIQGWCSWFSLIWLFCNKCRQLFWYFQIRKSSVSNDKRKVQIILFYNALWTFMVNISNSRYVNRIMSYTMGNIRDINMGFRYTFLAIRLIHFYGTHI